MTNRQHTYLLGREPVETRASMAGMNDAKQLANDWREGEGNTRHRNFTTPRDRARMADDTDTAANQQVWSGVLPEDAKPS